MRVYNEILMVKKYKLATHKDVDVDYVHLNTDLYPGVYMALVDMGLIPFMTFNCSYSEELVMQFNATVWFGNDDARTLYWMLGNRQCHAPMSAFGSIIGYNFFMQPNKDFVHVREPTF